MNLAEVYLNETAVMVADAAREGGSAPNGPGFGLACHYDDKGCAGEIGDHINPGRNMDTRTPASQRTYVV